MREVSFGNLWDILGMERRDNGIGKTSERVMSGDGGGISVCMSLYSREWTISVAKMAMWNAEDMDLNYPIRSSSQFMYRERRIVFCNN